MQNTTRLFVAVFCLFILVHICSATLTGTLNVAARGMLSIVDFKDEWNALHPGLTTTFDTKAKDGKEIPADMKSGTNKFDVYAAYWPKQLSFANQGYLLDMGDDHAAISDATLLTVVHDNLQFHNRTRKFQPIDADMHLLFYRTDLISSPPADWEALIEEASRLNGTDLNGDGIPDYGLCIGAIKHKLPMVAASLIKYSKDAHQQPWFDFSKDGVDQMTSNLASPGFEKSLDILTRLANVSQHSGVDEFGADVHVRKTIASSFNTVAPMFFNGRCAFMLGRSRLATAVVDTNKFNVTHPSNYWAATRFSATRPPGSKEVYDRATKKMTKCTEDLCPESGVNRPTTLFGCHVLSINAKTNNSEAALAFVKFAQMRSVVNRYSAKKPFHEANFNTSLFTDSAAIPWNPQAAGAFLRGTRDALSRSHSVGLMAGYEQYFDGDKAVETAIYELMRYDDYASSNKTLPEIFSELSTQLEATFKEPDGTWSRWMENSMRQAYNLPELVPLTNGSSSTTTTFIVESGANLKAGAIAGGVVGGVAALIAIFIIVVVVRAKIASRHAPVLSKQNNVLSAAILRVGLSTAAAADGDNAKNSDDDKSNALNLLFSAGLRRASTSLRKAASRHRCYVPPSSIRGKETILVVGIDSGDVLRCVEEVLSTTGLEGGCTLHAGLWSGPATRENAGLHPSYDGAAVYAAAEMAYISDTAGEIILPAEMVQDLTTSSTSSITSRNRHGLSSSEFSVAGNFRVRRGAIYEIYSKQIATPDVEQAPAKKNPFAVDNDGLLAVVNTNVLAPQEQSGTSHFTIDSASDDSGTSSVCNVELLAASRKGTVMVIRCNSSLLYDSDAVGAIMTTIDEFRGTVESVYPGGIIGVFGVHVPNVLHEQNAVRCAMAVNDQLQKQAHYDFRITVATGALDAGCVQMRKGADAASSNRKFGSKLKDVSSPAAVGGGGSRSWGLVTGEAMQVAQALCRFTLPDFHGHVLIDDDVARATKVVAVPVDVLGVALENGSKKVVTVLEAVDSSSSSSSKKKIDEGHDDDDDDIASSAEALKDFRRALRAMQQANYSDAVTALSLLAASHSNNSRVTALRDAALVRHGKDDHKPYIGAFDAVNLPNIRKKAAAVPTEPHTMTSSSNSTERTITTHQQQLEEQMRSFGGNLSEHQDGLFSMFVPEEPTATTATQSAKQNAAALELPIVFTDVDDNEWHRSIKPIGIGGNASVYLLVGPFGRLAVTKTFAATSQNFNHDEIAAEVAILAKLKHDHIVGYISHCFQANFIFIVMEHASGGSLYHLSRTQEKLSRAVVAKYVLDAVKGLVYLHGEGITHCDIKPANILVSSDGTCKLADFGSSVNNLAAKSTSDEPSLRGTAVYMAPEACLGSEGLASDIWSIGITTLELLIGAQPWGPRNPDIRGQLKFVSEVGNNEDMTPKIPSSIDADAVAFLKLCLNRDPVRRATAAQLLMSEFLQSI